MMVIKRLLYICPPNEVLIFSGGQRASASGRKVGYRIIKGGRAIRIPLFERVDRMDLTNMPIEVQVKGAYSRGGIPLNVHGIANVKVAGEQPVLDNAIERFLGVPRDRIMSVAKETLEGNLRGVLATLTPEEVNEDKIKFAQSLLDEAEDDLRRLGLELDTLKIQDVSDEVDYLDSIGRKQSAEVQKRALIAEANCGPSPPSGPPPTTRRPRSPAWTPSWARLRAENARRVADAQTRGRGHDRRGPGQGDLPAGPGRGRAGGAARPHRAGAQPAPGRRARAGPGPEGGGRGQRPGRGGQDRRAGAGHRPGHGARSRPPGSGWGRARARCS